VAIKAEMAQMRSLERTLKKFSFGFAVELRIGVGDEADGEQANLVCEMALRLWWSELEINRLSRYA
jgi:hypothetical protein